MVLVLDRFVSEGAVLFSVWVAGRWAALLWAALRYVNTALLESRYSFKVSYNRDNRSSNNGVNGAAHAVRATTPTSLALAMAESLGRACRGSEALSPPRRWTVVDAAAAALTAAALPVAAAPPAAAAALAAAAAALAAAAVSAQPATAWGRCECPPLAAADRVLLLLAVLLYGLGPSAPHHAVLLARE